MTNGQGRDTVHLLDLTEAAKAAEYYSNACQVPCRVINALGESLFRVPAESSTTAICDFAATALPGPRPDDDTNEPKAAPNTLLAKAQVSRICDNSHLYGCYQAERFGGRYIYFCPLGLTHWASPILYNGTVVGALIGGPVHMVDPDEFMIDDIVMKNGVHPAFMPELHRQMKKVTVVGTGRVNSLSELLYFVASSLSDESFRSLRQKRDSGDLQAQLWEQINFLKSFAFAGDEVLAYPIEKEQQLLDLIETGDKSGSQKVLNEILGHIFFSSSGSLQVMQARVIELVVLLSRAAIRGGADVQQIFGLNYTYLNRINSFHNIDEIAYWLSGIMARFTDQVFNLTNVKHADVIYRAIDYIKKNYMKKVTLEDTAAFVFLSPAYFSRVFKEEMNENFNTYVNMIRVEAARKLLLNEKIPLVEIASMIGFEGQSYFSKVFKKMTGVTPGKFRESRGKGH